MSLAPELIFYKMSARAVKNPSLKGYRRKKAVLNLDLNTTPIENPEQEGTSNQAAFQSVVDTIAPIDVEAIEDDDDDVAFCTPSAFAEVLCFSCLSLFLLIYFLQGITIVTGFCLSDDIRRKTSLKRTGEGPLLLMLIQVLKTFGN